MSNYTNQLQSVSLSAREEGIQLVQSQTPHPVLYLAWPAMCSAAPSRGLWREGGREGGREGRREGGRVKE